MSRRNSVIPKMPTRHWTRKCFVITSVVAMVAVDDFIPGLKKHRATLECSTSAVIDPFHQMTDRS